MFSFPKTLDDSEVALMMGSSDASRGNLRQHFTSTLKLIVHTMGSRKMSKGFV